MPFVFIYLLIYDYTNLLNSNVLRNDKYGQGSSDSFVHIGGQMLNSLFGRKFILVLFIISWHSPVFGSELKEDEDVIVYPGYLYLDKTNSNVYKTDIHIQVFKKKEDSIKRRLLIESFKKHIQVEHTDSPQLLENRLRWFLVDNKRGKELSVTILGETYKLNKTKANGHSTTQIQIKADQIGEEELLEKKILIQVVPEKKKYK